MPMPPMPCSQKTKEGNGRAPNAGEGRTTGGEQKGVAVREGISWSKGGGARAHSQSIDTRVVKRRRRGLRLRSSARGTSHAAFTHHERCELLGFEGHNLLGRCRSKDRQADGNSSLHCCLRVAERSLILVSIMICSITCIINIIVYFLSYIILAVLSKLIQLIKKLGMFADRATRAVALVRCYRALVASSGVLCSATAFVVRRTASS